jgi:hypothetical protein
MEHAGLFIDVVQTTGIVFIAIVLAYVVWRLEGQFRAWGSTLHEVNRRLKEQAGDAKEQETVLDSLNKIWGRINAIEKRLDMIEQRDS